MFCKLYFTLAASAGLVLATFGSVASANTIIVSDGFSGTNGTSINGRTPDGADLPGSTWQVEQQGVTGFPMTIVSTPSPSVRTNFNDAAGISIASANGYVKPADLTISASVEVNNSNLVGVGFYGSLPAPGSQSSVGFVGVQWNSDQNVFLENGGSNISLGTFSLGLDSFYTLSYSVNTTTGSMSNLTFDGQTISTPATSIFTGIATDMAGFYSYSNSPTDTGYVANFSVSSADTVVVPEPATICLVAVGGMGLLLVGRKRAARRSA